VLLCGLPQSQLHKLQRIQNTAARIITRTRRYDHIRPVLYNLHWLPIKRRIDFKVLLYTFKALNGLAPAYLADLLQRHIPPRPLRSQDQLRLDTPSTRLCTYGDRRFAKMAPTLWNSLPLPIKQATSIGTFKTMLKTYLFKLEYC